MSTFSKWKNKSQNYWPPRIKDNNKYTVDGGARTLSRHDNYWKRFKEYPFKAIKYEELERT